MNKKIKNRNAMRRYREKFKEKAYAYDLKIIKEVRLRNQKFLLAHLQSNPCVDCGNINPLVLDLDHRYRGDKLRTVSTMANGTWSLKAIQNELDKCDVRCANCHRIKTAHQMNWVKLELLKTHLSN